MIPLTPSVLFDEPIFDSAGDEILACHYCGDYGCFGECFYNDYEEEYDDAQYCYSSY